MQIVCKQCNATYTIPVNNLPKDKTATAQCKQCGYKIILNPDVSSSKLPAAAFTSAPQPAHAPQPVSALTREILSVVPELASYGHYNLPEIFSADKKGRYKHRGNQMKAKILIAVEATLTRILRPNEQILRVAAGTAHHPIEILFGNGIFTMLYNRYAIIATDQRLVMINTNHSMTSLRHYLFQMPYDEIKKVSRGLFRTSLTLTPKKGKRRTFTSMKASLSGELVECITPRLNLQKDLPASAMKPNLCPACFCALGVQLNQCSSCRTDFKRPFSAALRSLVLPGLGDLYLGHRALGYLEMVGSLFVWLVALSFFLAGGPEDVVIAAIIIFLYNGMDALLTLHMGKKGYIAANKPAAGNHAQLAPSRV